MHVIHRRGWELPEREATPRTPVLRSPSFAGRRPAPRRFAAGRPEPRRRSATTDPREPAPTRARRVISGEAQREIHRSTGRSPTRRSTTSYNNTTTNSAPTKTISRRQRKRCRSAHGTVKIDGLVERARRRSAIDDLLAKMPLEERLYRHRCRRGMVDGGPMVGLFRSPGLVEPGEGRSGSAKYLRMETFPQFVSRDPASAPRPGIRGPMVEGLTMAEGDQRDRFSLVHRRLRPSRSPNRWARRWRLAVGRGSTDFKSIKIDHSFQLHGASGRRVFGKRCRSAEYGLFGRTSIQQVPHPRWSQATERDIATGGAPADAFCSTATANTSRASTKGLESERFVGGETAVEPFSVPMESETEALFLCFF